MVVSRFHQNDEITLVFQHPPFGWPASFAERTDLIELDKIELAMLVNAPQYWC